MLEAVALLIVGLVLLVWSADKLVFGSAALVQRRYFTSSDRYDNPSNGFICAGNDGFGDSSMGWKNRYCRW